MIENYYEMRSTESLVASYACAVGLHLDFKREFKLAAEDVYVRGILDGHS